MAYCGKCIHLDVCKSADACDGHVPRCKHFMDKDEHPKQKRGQWVNPFINRYGHPCHCCSECGFEASHQDKNFCPDCGARMEV